MEESHINTKIIKLKTIRKKRNKKSWLRLVSRFVFSIRNYCIGEFNKKYKVQKISIIWNLEETFPEVLWKILFMVFLTKSFGSIFKLEMSMMVLNSTNVLEGMLTLRKDKWIIICKVLSKSHKNFNEIPRIKERIMFKVIIPVSAMLVLEAINSRI